MSLKNYVNQKVFALVSTNSNTESADRNIVVIKCIHTKLIGLYNLKIRFMFKYILKYKSNYEEIHLIHAHYLYFDGDIAFRLSKKFNKKYIVTIRGSDMYIFKNRQYLKNRGFKILRNASKVIFISQAHRDFFFNKVISKLKDKIDFQEKAIVIPNGINNFWIKNRFQKIKPRCNNKIKILTVAGIDSNKNHNLVIEAIKVLISKGYNIEYTIIGNVLNKSIFKQLMKYEFVDYYQELSKEELITFYRSSDVFVMPSHSETFGLVYIESLTQGLPVVYTKGQGIDGLFNQDDIGYSVDPNNHLELAGVILKAVDNQFNKINTMNLDDFEWENIAAKYSDLYQECLNKKLTLL